MKFGSTETRYGSFSNFARKQLNEERIQGYASQNGASTLFARYSALRHQINEDLPEIRPTPIGSERLFLPLLSNVKIDTLMNVMQDYGDPTARFRSMLRRALRPNQSSDLDFDRRFFDLMEEIDIELRNLHESFRVIKKNKILRKAEAGLGLVSVGLGIFAPQFVAETAAGIFGTATAIDGARNVLRSNETEKQFKSSDMYLPWLVSTYS